MKRIILTFETDKDFKEHLDAQAIKNNKSRSAYIIAVLKAKSKYKEKIL